jgi:hypothetical protein
MAENKKVEALEAQAVAPEAAPTEKKKFDFTSLNTLAVVSLASGISVVGALVAVITGHISLAQIRKSGESGRSLAIVGTILGYLHLAGWIVFSLLAIASTALMYSGFMGLEPGGLGHMEFRDGFKGMHMWGDR